MRKKGLTEEGQTKGGWKELQWRGGEWRCMQRELDASDQHGPNILPKDQNYFAGDFQDPVSGVFVAIGSMRGCPAFKWMVRALSAGANAILRWQCAHDPVLAS